MERSIAAGLADGRSLNTVWGGADFFQPALAACCSSSAWLHVFLASLAPHQWDPSNQDLPRHKTWHAWVAFFWGSHQLKATAR